MSIYKFMCWPGFRNKALTLSYDDSVSADRRLIEIMNKNGIKGTFNLNSGLFGDIPIRMGYDDVYDTYKECGQEIAVHGAKHYILPYYPDSMKMADILDDKRALEKMFGVIITGMAYSCGNYDQAGREIAESCGIKYARITGSSERFDIPVDFMKIHPTSHHGNPHLMELAKKFVESKCDKWIYKTPELFYLWGHSYEFDREDNWHVIEDFCSYMGGRDDIWYATNGEIYDYVTAFKSLRFSAEGTRVYNPSALDVYIEWGRGKQYLIPSGKTVELD